jgi:4-alpha-glucanotransferase
VLTIESNRHAAILIGEDLGTVPPEVRTAMAKHGVKRMFVVQFEASEAEPPIGDIPDQAVASLNTHDMPTFRSFWEGDDADLRKELGLIDNDGVKEAKNSRKIIAKNLSKYLGAKSLLSTPDALRATLKYLAQSSADIVLLNLEDIWLEELPQNVPGTSVERPNWRRRLRYTIDEIKKDSLVQEAVQMVACERGSDNA